MRFALFSSSCSSITRSFVAALVIVGTVALSLGASFGLSVLVWQYILGIKLHWMVLPMSVIILLAVGSDYNLLLVSRMKEEISRRHKHRHHPRNGRYRKGGDERGPGVRFHHGLDGVQRSAGYRPARYHYRPGSVVRHLGRALVYDTVHRRAAWTLVLVATESSPAACQFHASVRAAASVVRSLLLRDAQRDSDPATVEVPTRVRLARRGASSALDMLRGRRIGACLARNSDM